MLEKRRIYLCGKRLENLKFRHNFDTHCRDYSVTYIDIRSLASINKRVRTKSSAKKSQTEEEKFHKNLAHIPLNAPKRSFHVSRRPPIHLPQLSPVDLSSLPRNLVAHPPPFPFSRIPKLLPQKLLLSSLLMSHQVFARQIRRRAYGAFQNYPLSLSLTLVLPPLRIRSQRLR